MKVVRYAGYFQQQLDFVGVSRFRMGKQREVFGHGSSRRCSQRFVRISTLAEGLLVVDHYQTGVHGFFLKGFSE